jgi:hypothetical protein
MKKDTGGKFKIVVWKSKGEEPLGRPRHRCDSSSKMDSKWDAKT